jgi:hypothetical protein
MVRRFVPLVFSSGAPTVGRTDFRGPGSLQLPAFVGGEVSASEELSELIGRNGFEKVEAQVWTGRVRWRCHWSEAVLNFLELCYSRFPAAPLVPLKKEILMSFRICVCNGESFVL